MPLTSAMQCTPKADADCRRIRVRGQVQGVGFRPFVFRLARELQLTGWVRNDSAGVLIEAQGEACALDTLIRRLKSDAPPLARIDALEIALETPDAPLTNATSFVIAESHGGKAQTGVTPDAVTCPDCLAEMCDPADRRWRYAFINCTHCGPRYTLTRALPYDRPQTSMAAFRQCAACQREYDDPADRRFHAQPNACPACGPQLRLLNETGSSLAGDAIAATLGLLARGKIVAIKGLGGFHLACDARNAAAVARLRERKQREEKPFAVMLANAASAQAYVDLSHVERALLTARERPIVLLKKRAACDAALPGLAPGLAWLGVMLPYTPLHTLLFHEAAGRPADAAWVDVPQPLALVMTSANPGGEPIVRDNAEALARLGGIADAFLLHDRDIVTRCDDSVLRAIGTAQQTPHFQAHSPAHFQSHFQIIRRARGYTPQAIKLSRAGPSVLALGGHLKNTVCLTRGDEAFVSQHIGDLDNASTCAALEETAARLMALLEIEPQIVVHDLHPDFYSTRLAAQLAQTRGIPTLAVQHHHAHIAAVAAEHGLEEPLLGLALDGFGLGEEGGVAGGLWGGELLLVDGAQCQRLAHFRRIALPGGDRAAREPWRMAASALHALGRTDEIETRFTQAGARTVAHMLRNGLNTPLTSSCGRWFDAAAGLLGVRDITAYEGQAAMLLEGLADGYGTVDPLPGAYILAGGTLDLSPLMAYLAEECDIARGAARFHATLAQALAAWVIDAVSQTGIRRIALGGGCFLNRVLSTDLRGRLIAAGLAVFEASQLPPNDGGLSLGQAWIALRKTQSDID